MLLSFAEVRIGRQELLVTLIARRSRHFAGTRYIKRGIDQRGYVANEVESELLVEHKGLCALVDCVCVYSCDRLGGPNRGGLSSVVVLRGSIPLFWSQENPRDLHPQIVGAHARVCSNMY